MPSKISRYLYFISICFILFSCNVPEKRQREYTYFGGEVVNPNTNYVILSKDASHSDTTYLNSQNRFIFKLENLENGLYTFRHQPEYQTVLLEKGDSIMMRLNTIEFDETLVYTGDGAVKNNFLMDMFLQNEKELIDLRRNNFELPPELFKIKQDSLLKRRRKEFEKFYKKNDLSTLSKNIAQASYEYDFYSRFELYSYKNEQENNQNQVLKYQLPPSFFEYRSNVNFNDDDLKRLPSYTRFIIYYIDNQLQKKYSKKHGLKNPVLLASQEIDLIDSLVTHSYIKNNLLRRVLGNFLLKSKNAQDSKKLLDHYISKNTNKEFQKEIIKLAEATIRLIPDNQIPDQKLISSDRKIVYLSSLFRKPFTALYFWSTENKDHYMKAHRKASLLRSLYQNVDFIGINTNEDQTQNWLKTIKRNQYDPAFEYEFKDPKCASEDLVIHYQNKVILVDKEGKIINPNSNLFSAGFEKQLIQANDPLVSK